MTNLTNREYRNFEALRALIAFVCMLFIIAACLDVGYYNAKKYNIQKGLEASVLTGVMGLPNVPLARHLTLNVANSQGLALEPYEIMIDPNGRWIQVDKLDYYDTIFLCNVGIKRIPINAHVFEY